MTVRLELGALEAHVDPSAGGRLSVLRYDGVDLVVPPGRVPGFWGDTFWPSPQSLFDWPPPAALDADPYEVIRRTEAGLELRSAEDPTLGLQVQKGYQIGADAIGFRFVMRNTGLAERSLAPWQVTRAPRRGLVLWAPGERFDDADRVVKHREDPGCWYWHERLPAFAGYAQGDGWASIHVPEVTTTSKFFTDAQGWSAHVHSGVLVLRLFPDLRPAQMAPRQAELEVFFGIERDYIELENQGAYEALAPGQACRYAVQWRIGRLPEGIPEDRVTPGLLEAIDELRRRPTLTG